MGRSTSRLMLAVLGGLVEFERESNRRENRRRPRRREGGGARFASIRYPPRLSCRASRRASLSHEEAIPRRGEVKFRTIQACPKDPLTLPLAGWTMRQTD